jgi:dephospho-CoA kinase
MLVVGLTGGIGSGKSTVATSFAALGVPVVDADTIVRELVTPGEPAFREIVAAFGDDVIAPDGALDRARLRRIMLADAERRRRLEEILHPRVRAEIRRHVAALDAPYCILSVPLLIESGRDRYPIDRLLVVDCPEPLQRSRVAARDRWSPAEIDAMIAAQTTRERRLQAADDVLVNDRDLDALESQVQALHRRYLALSAAHDSPDSGP